MHRGTTTGHGADRRWRRMLAACLLGLLVTGAVGCGGDSSQSDADAARARAQAAAHARQMALGRRVFATHCQSCHTLAGRRYEGEIIEFEAPNLDEVRLNRKYVEQRVETGGPAMASFRGEIPEDGYRAVIAYVTEAAGRSVVDDGDQPADLLAQGKEVFQQNCAGCHAIEGRAANGRPIYPGTDFTLAKPSERMVVQKVTHGILPEEPMMPSFRGKLTPAQVRAVAAYVTAEAGEGPIAPQPYPLP